MYVLQELEVGLTVAESLGLSFLYAVRDLESTNKSFRGKKKVPSAYRTSMSLEKLWDDLQLVLEGCAYNLVFYTLPKKGQTKLGLLINRDSNTIYNKVVK